MDLLKLRQSELIKQMIRFVITGTIAAGIYSSCFVALLYCDLHYLVAASSAFIVATCFNYAVSIKWVFRGKAAGSKKIFILFVIFSIVTMGLNNLLLYIGVDIMQLPLPLSTVIAIAAVMGINFVGRKLLFAYGHKQARTLRPSY